MDRSDLRDKPYKEPSAELSAPEDTAADLRRLTERFQLAERAANGFVYDWDVRTGQLFRSAGVERLLGFGPKTSHRLGKPGRSWSTQAIGRRRRIRGISVSGGAARRDVGDRISHPPSRRPYLTVADYALIERDAAGKVTRLIGQTHDISERKRAEEALRTSEEEYRTLFNAIDEAFFVIALVRDESGQPVDLQYVKANPAFESLTGISVEEVLGHTVRELIPNIDPPSARRVRQGR